MEIDEEEWPINEVVDDLKSILGDYHYFLECEEKGEKKVLGWRGNLESAAIALEDYIYVYMIYMLKKHCT